VTFNFNNNMSTAAGFLDIEKTFDTTWLISSCHKENSFSVEGKMSTPREMQAEVPQGSFLSPTAHSMYINDALETPGVHLPLFADDTCLYATDRNEGCYQKTAERSQLNGDVV
jgi:phage-related protein